MRRVQDVDVDGDVQRAVADALAQLVGDLVDTAAHDVGGGDDAEAHLGVVVEVLLAVQRTAGADVGERGRVEDALLDGPAERRAVGVLGAEVGVPRVEVGVEVEQGYGAVLLRDGAQEGQRDGVVAAEGHHAGAGTEQIVGRGLDRLDGLVDVERVGGDVTGVGDLREGERRGVLCRVVRAQQARRLTDGVAAEAGAGAVRDTRVEGHADDGDIGGADLVEAGQPRERRWPGVPRDAGGVDGAARRFVAAHGECLSSDDAGWCGYNGLRPQSPDGLGLPARRLRTTGPGSSPSMGHLPSR